jgi:CheY-like chemotaxis protein
MIEGGLRDAPLPDVFQVIVSGQKSGVLTVAKGETRARIYFDEGRVQYAHISPGVHLGELLVRLDLLTSHEVQDILLKQTLEDPGIPLGLLAIQRGLLDDGELQRAIKAQVLEVLTELMTWRSGSFIFAERSNAASQALSERTLDTGALLLEVARRLEEWREGNVAPEAIFIKAGDPTKVKLPRGGWEILGYLDGKRNAASVAAELDLSEKQVYHILYELQSLGVVQPLPFQVDEPLVLVVSASSALQRLVRLALQRARLTSLIASDFKVAMELLPANHPSALVVDDEGGETWEFVRSLRKLPGQGHLPVLVLSTESSRPGMLGRLRRPKATVLAKPFHEIELQQLVTQMVGRPLA